MGKAVLWGIYREELHSPGRRSDDRRIMDAVVARLRHVGEVEVHAFHPHELPWESPVLPDLVFFMCESRPVLERLAGWEARGVAMVNPLQGVRNTYRAATVSLLAREEYFPSTRFASSDAPASLVLAPGARVWVKRGDYHATCPDDVLPATTPEELAGALDRFRERGIPRVVVQDHVEGDLIKFYGVRDHAAGATRWFTCFYHANQVRRDFPVDRSRLQAICERGAARLDLEVFGGDVIVTETGEMRTIDFNAWPSYALYRDEAADHIARHVVSRCTGSARSLARATEAAAR